MAEEIGYNYPVNVPSYSEDADIKSAIKLYHYGSYSYNQNLTDPATLPDPSIARYLYEINTEIDTIQTDLSGKIGASTFNAKGDLLVGTADNALSVLSTAPNGKVLVTNSGTSTGLEWQDPTSSFTNLSAATLNVSGNAVFHISIVPKTTSYTPTAGDISDDGKLLTFSSTSAHTFTIPTNANNPYPTGTQISVLQIGPGQTSIVGASGVTVNCTPQPTANTAKLRTQWSSATLIKTGTNSWVVIGDLSAVA